jgi:SPX domain protein involved in polyphosphate accumulation
MLLSNEEIPRLSGMDWCARPTDWRRGDTIDFPYAILEIKLQDASPEWVSEVVGLPYITPVKKFSVRFLSILEGVLFFVPHAWRTEIPNGMCAVSHGAHRASPALVYG